MRLPQNAAWVIAAVLAGGMAAAIPPLITVSRSSKSAEPVRMAPGIGMPGAPPTSADGLRQRIAEMEARLEQVPGDRAASILLRDALLRQARSTLDGRAANRATTALEAVLKNEPDQYDALRLLGAVQLSRHRFRDALDTAQRARDRRPDDAWNYGVIGDASIELGDYDAAFAAFDRMVTLRPGADAYARVAYARELRGDLEGSLEVMQMAADATSAHDAEAKAWFVVHVGELCLRLGRLDEAEREFRRAGFFYPDY